MLRIISLGSAGIQNRGRTGRNSAGNGTLAERVQYLNEHDSRELKIQAQQTSYGDLGPLEFIMQEELMDDSNQLSKSKI